MELSAPTQPVFLVALIVGVLAIIGGFVAIPFVTANASWLLIAAFALLLPPAAGAAGPASAVLLECDREFAAAEFQARMETVPEAERMRMRFTLEVRRQGRRHWKRVPAPGFGVWTAADPGVTRYVHSRRVEELLGPARYRVVVRFRWANASGATVARDRRVSRSCRQPDTRPNLVVEDLAFDVADDPLERRYAVLVRNAGRGAVGPFDLAVAGLEPVEVDGLDPHEERLVEVDGPVCEPGLPVTAVADPDDLVDERWERDNELTRSCE